MTDQWKKLTPAEFQEYMAEMDVARERIIADCAGDSMGTRVGRVECPRCGGLMKYRVSGLNGHIWASCKTDFCLNWKE